MSRRVAAATTVAAAWSLLASCQAGSPVKMKLITAPPPGDDGELFSRDLAVLTEAELDDGATLHVAHRTAPPTLGEVNREHVNYNLTPRVPKANFTGPPALYGLFGQCFPDVIGNYEWRVCPFDNVTQHQVNAGAWSTFNGIIGVWKGYDVANGTVSHLTFEHGDNCAGGKQRSARVALVCGESNQTLSATEPAPCEYDIVLETTLACNGSLDLVNVLDNATRDLLTEHDQALDNGELTRKGHSARVRRTLAKVGFFPGPTHVRTTTTTTTPSPTPEPTVATTTTTAAPTTAAPTPPSLTELLDNCTADRAALEARVSELTSELRSMRSKLNSIFSLVGRPLEEEEAREESTSATAAGGGAAADAATSVGAPTKAKATKKNIAAKKKASKIKSHERPVMAAIDTIRGGASSDNAPPPPSDGAGARGAASREAVGAAAAGKRASAGDHHAKAGAPAKKHAPHAHKVSEESASAAAGMHAVAAHEDAHEASHKQHHRRAAASDKATPPSAHRKVHKSRHGASVTATQPVPKDASHGHGHRHHALPSSHPHSTGAAATHGKAGKTRG